MKKFGYITLVLLSLLEFASSCKRSLELVPVETQTKGFVFNPKDSAGTSAINFLTNVYTYMPTGYARIGTTDFDEKDGDFLDCATDDGISSATGQSPVELMETGGLTTFYNPDDAFINTFGVHRDLYAGIRAATIFINNIDVVPIKGTLNDGTGRSLKAAYKAEARFLRAYFYFELLKRYGGIPLLGNTVASSGDAINLPRSSFSDCVNYITTELDTAEKYLRLDPVSGQNFGRIGKGAAMALQSRLLLYAASPLFNGGNIDGSNPLTGYPSLDKNRWKLAADAAQAVISYGAFSLDSSFNDLFISQTNPEQILVYSPQRFGQLIEIANGPVNVGNGIGQGRTGPTQELADAFGTINGQPITTDVIAGDPTGYDASNPFANRDPRFYQTFLYNGQTWLGTALQTYDGGRSKPGGVIQQTKTGYYLRKFMGDWTNSANGYGDVYHNFIAFRYGETLLNYAEAQNEYLGGPDQSVYNALILLRKRAGINKGTNSNYGLAPNMNQSQMRAVIQNERRVELAFEEHRFWDIRRWKIAEQVYNVPLHGYDVVRNTYTGGFSASVQPVLTTTFISPKMYLYPIPYNELVSDPNLKQNPGW